MDIKKFARLTESLRKFQRAELKEFEKEIGSKPVDTLYVDPLPNNAILSTVLSSNTTFLFGRKGTGKSTIIARAQSELRKSKECLSVYLDVKSINESSQTSDILNKKFENIELSQEIIQPHLLRKAFLVEIFTSFIDEMEGLCKQTGIIDRFLGKKKKYEDIINELLTLRSKVRAGILNDAELPILQIIDSEIKNKSQLKTKEETTTAVGITVGTKISSKADARLSNYEEALEDNEFYDKYSKAVLRTFPYQDLIQKLTQLLDELSFKYLVIFLDDFSELSWVDQRLFVDVVLAPLNNTSKEKIKLKIAAYPGRAYYGNIDPGKVDILNLDFFQLYKSSRTNHGSKSC